SDISLEHTIQYYNTKKENFKQPVWQIVLHVVNHSTYHRGQLINMLRQVGVEKLPHTDFIYWTRKK
ncbi:MAG TPA: DinB family protein, partial [Chitinophagaceae bacterium]|nr:DinB family protein [Chitinophagaceae bacterium]